GAKFIYANPLQVREGHVAGGNDGDYERRSWFHCACCPPNVMRTLASLEHYVVLSNAEEIRVHQYIPGRYTATVGGGEATLSVTTEYPWEGQVCIVVDSAAGDEWGLGVRVPHWADSASALVNGEAVTAEPHDGWLTVTRRWAAGDQFVLDLPLEVRFTYADTRVDAARGSIALERGPLVYCLEAADNPGQRLDDIVIDTASAPVVERHANLLGGVTTIRVQGLWRSRPNESWWPYGSKASRSPASPLPQTIALCAVPYFSWGNRGEGAMRVWTPAG
ncbi:MAG: glycoside hydrolase family 127 protein, partial [Actinomycetota bacterium]|nr:glycoside hydrolase family 127 protein [Actinomycetota bacterium]